METELYELKIEIMRLRSEVEDLRADLRLRKRPTAAADLPQALFMVLRTAHEQAPVIGEPMKRLWSRCSAIWIDLMGDEPSPILQPTSLGRIIRSNRDKLVEFLELDRVEIKHCRDGEGKNLSWRITFHERLNAEG